MEAIIGIRRKQFSNKELIIANGQLIFWLEETIFFLYFSETPASDSFFLLSSGNDVSRKSFILASGILFQLNKNSDSTSRNEGLVKNIPFHYAEKLLSPAVIYIKNA